MSKNGDYKLRVKRRKKEQAVSALGGKCQICGYDKCLGGLDFHHIVGDKDFDISTSIMRWKWETIKKELDKCILLCANCHREVHYKEVPNHDLIYLRREWRKVECPTCKKVFDTKNEKQIFCSGMCQGFSCRKTTHPSKEELKSLLDNGTPWVKLGRMFGVSDNAVRKWAKRHQLI